MSSSFPLNNIPIAILRNTLGADSKLTKTAEFIDANYQPRKKTTPDYMESRATHNDRVELHELALKNDPFFPKEYAPYVDALSAVLANASPSEKVQFDRTETSSKRTSTAPSEVPVAQFQGDELAAVQALLTKQQRQDVLEFKTISVGQNSTLFNERFGKDMADKLRAHFQATVTRSPPPGTIDKPLTTDPNFPATSMFVRATNHIDGSGNVSSVSRDIHIQTKPNAIIAFKYSDEAMDYSVWSPLTSGYYGQNVVQFTRADANGNAVIPAQASKDYLMNTGGTMITVLDADSAQVLGRKRVLVPPANTHEHV